ncbi:acyl-CoA synthetase [Spongiibacter sp. UBA1325]|uniref:acyl-CoA synthetase n=1 Tax=Spongiibacter sp. UBA1325 TaxID=1947543 RepID=UPI00257A50F3|nr:acyl-CoA synthetase [Spongiibacter sp. UBA1325]|tara:strand:- start:6023 stop:7576 length:1554 start_codon:yes stop_codon:yes gene_type:complete
MTNIGFWHYAEKDPAPLALVAPNGDEITRGALLKECNQLVHGLRQLGMEPGDVVAVIMPNCKEMIAINLAILQAGFYMVPINWHLAGSEVAYILEDSGAKVFISHERIKDAATQAVAEANFDTQRAFAIGDIPGWRPYSDIIAEQPHTLPDNRSAGAVMNYTSGTTGKPKGVRRPLTGLSPEVGAQMSSGILLMLGTLPEDNNVNITGSPLYHTAVMAWASGSLHLGHAVVLMDKWEPEEMLRLIEKYRVTTSHMVPTQFIRLLKLPEQTREKYDCSSTRRMVHAAAPCPPDVKRAMIEWWGLSIYEYYAATEGGGTIVSPEEWLKYPGTVGKAWPEADIKIFDDDANELPVGEQGTVYMRLTERGNFEYKGNAKNTAENRIGNYFTVGDIGYLNEEGYLFLCDRKIDMIISGGANIYPAEIENVLILHEKVADCAVFGVPNDEWGEEIKAVVQPAEGVGSDDATTQEIMDFLASRIAKMKLPRSIDYLDALPRDPNGKLFKRRLRDPYWEGRQRQV